MKPQLVEGRSFTSIPRWMQTVFIIIILAMVVALCFAVVDKQIPRDSPQWIDPAESLPEPDTPIIGVYLIDGKQEPIRVLYFYAFDENANKTEWWKLDNDMAQVNMGRPYRWTPALIVPDVLLWSTIRDGRELSGKR